MQIGGDLVLMDGQPYVIALLCGVIWSLGTARSNRWWLEVVLRLNPEQCAKEYVRGYG